MATRFLNNIKVNDAYTLPASDGTNGQAVTTDGSGALSFTDITVDEAPSIGLTVKNVSGGTLAIGTVVHPSPTASPPSGNVIEVIAADNSAASTMPAIGVLKAALADDAEGTAIAFGRVSSLDTSSFTAGDALYVSASGAFTTTKPTGTSLIQKIGVVIKSHASSGTIEVFGANRTNDVPAPLYVDIPNSRVGIGDTTPSVTLDISATDAVQLPVGTTAQRPTAAAGMIRYNSTDGSFEGYTSEWGAIGGGDDYSLKSITKNASNQFPITFADSTNFKLSASGTWTITATIASGDVGKSGIILIVNTAATTPGTLPSTFKTPNGDNIVFETDSGDYSVISYFIASTTHVLVNYVGNFS